MDYMIKANILIVVFLLLYAILFNRFTFYNANRIYLLGALILGLTLPLIKIPIYIIQEPSNYIINNLQRTNFSINDTGLFTPLLVVTFIYWLVTLGLIGRLVFQLLSIRQIVKSSDKTIKNGIHYITPKQPTLPFSFFNYIIYTPEAFNQKELKLILAHESIHVKQWHSIDIIAASLVSCFFWMNPFIWLYKKAIQQNLEFLADSYCTIKTSRTDYKNYQKLILKTLIAPVNQSPIINSFYSTNSLKLRFNKPFFSIKNRIIMLQKNTTNQKFILSYFLILPIAFCFLFLFNTEAKAQTEVETSKNVIIKNIHWRVDKNSTDDQIKRTIKGLNELDVTVEINDIKRNSKNEIEHLQLVAFYTENSSEKTHYTAATVNNSIQDFALMLNPDTNTISIGTEAKLDFGNSFVAVKNNTDGSTALMQLKNGEVVSTKHINKHLNENENNPLYIVDNKIYEKEAIDKISPNDITSVKVIKGENAINIYGEKGKNGVIEITLKEKK